MGVDYIDVSHKIDDPGNYFLECEGGLIIFVAFDQFRYDVHTSFLRLKDASKLYKRDCSLAAYRWMFTRTDAVELVTRIPGHNRAAAFAAPLVGWTKEFERDAVWPTADGMVGMSFWSLRYDDWVRKTPSLVESGRWFHDRMKAECKRLGFTEERHADEECHDIHVGAAVEMIFGGQLEKGLILYNRWARFAGYGEIALISRSPLLIDIGDALLHILDDTFRVVKCRPAH